MTTTKLSAALLLLLTALLGITYADFKVPINDTNFNTNQGRIYTTDFDALVQGVKGEGVVSGGTVTAQGTPDMTVAVASGNVKIAGALAVVASGNVTITAANATYPRIDIVVVNASGTKSVTAGAATSATPVMPSIPASSVILAAVYVPANDTAITSGQIVDKRVLVQSQAYLLYEDQKTQNTYGGTFTSGAWRTRTLNTEVADTGGLGTLASNQITLAAGTYRIAVSAPAYGVDRHQARLQNVTDATTVLLGASAYSANNTGAGQASIVSTIQGVFTIAASKALEVQHQGQTTESSDGFGVAANFATEIYTRVELWKIE